MALTTKLDLDEVKWGDLLAFTDMGRAAGVDADSVVEQVWAESGYLAGWQIALPAGVSTRRPVISAEEGADFADVLDQILMGEGDARTYQGKLAELRDKLLGLD